MPYADALALQEALRERLARGAGGETVLLLEHPDVITFGRGAAESNASASDTELQKQGYEVFRVGRGGEVTWHGPGQLVGYPILDLRRHGADVHRYLRDLEAVLIAALADFGVEARRREGFAGVWLDARRKIASIGVGVRAWRTLHGFALNVDCDLARFGAIVPCGLAGVEMVSMASVLGRAIAVDDVVSCVEDQLRKVFA
ncbi:MAG TPA: lipoyl(octanoyl) transferase LipB [Myxococcota bacterium]|nr:lipoyl(octanoyl) transferase LipB [Myxococcota bacterium]